MTYEEALTVTEFVVNCWPDGRFWTPEQIAAYAKGIQNLDGALATRAVERAQKTMDHRPKVNELISICRSLAVNAVVEPPASGKPSKMPLVVKEWICARYLYASFGRTLDMRRFAFQGDWGDPYAPLMPVGEWANEAASLADGRAWTIFRGAQ